MVETKEQCDAFILKLMNDNTTHVKDYEIVCRLCAMVDELQACAETAEREVLKYKSLFNTTSAQMHELQWGFSRVKLEGEKAEQERDTLAARVKELEAGLRDMQSMGMHSVYTVLDQARRILEGKR